MEFKNTYTETKSSLGRFYKKCVLGIYAKIGLVIVILGLIQLATLLAGIFGFIQSSLSGTGKVLFFDLAIFLIALGVLISCYPMILGRVTYRHLKKKCGGQVVATTLEFADQISVSEGGTKLVYQYSYITKLIETSEEYVMMNGKYSGIRAVKGAFEVGEEEAFKAFIMEKRPKLIWTKK